MDIILKSLISLSRNRVWVFIGRLGSGSGSGSVDDGLLVVVVVVAFVVAAVPAFVVVVAAVVVVLVLVGLRVEPEFNPLFG